MGPSPWEGEGDTGGVGVCASGPCSRWKVVTAIKPRWGQHKRFHIFLDGSFAFSLEAQVLAEAHLAVGQRLSEGEVLGLTRADEIRRCLEAVLRYLSYRPRSEAELKARLLRQGREEGVVVEVLGRLREQGLLDDTAFTRFWVDDRLSHSPRSGSLLRQELRQKGVPQETLKEITSVVDDEDSAYRAGRKKALSLAGCDFNTFHRRLSGYLQRRGFGYDTTRRAVNTLWQEIEESAGSKEEAP